MYTYCAIFGPRGRAPSLVSGSGGRAARKTVFREGNPPNCRQRDLAWCAQRLATHVPQLVASLSYFKIMNC